MTKKILIIRFSSIGDIVLTTPVVRALKTQLKAEIHYATKTGYKFLVDDNPYIDKVHLLAHSTSALIKALKQEHFDYIIDLHGNIRSRLIKWSLGGKSFTYNKLNFEKWLLVNFKINRLPSEHIVDRYMKTVAPLEVEYDGEGLDYFIPHKDVVENEWLPQAYRHNYVAFAIGGQHATKQLTANKLIELCDKINRPIILLGGKEDAILGEKIAAFFSRDDRSESANKTLQTEFNKKTIVFNACGKFNLNQSASVVQQASYVFTHDTGMMHIAAAFKKYIFSIWGNTVPEFGMYPFETRFTIFETPGLKCRPCSKIGFDQCPKGHFKCMNKQKFDFYLPE